MERFSADTPLWYAARTLLLQRCSELSRHWRRACRRFEPEPLHDLRVSSRRMREAVTLFAPCFRPQDVLRLSRRLKKVTRSLGAVRNLDEASGFFATVAQTCGYEGIGQLATDLVRERAIELKVLKRRLKNYGSSGRMKLFRGNCDRLRLSSNSDVDVMEPYRSFMLRALSVHEQAIGELLPAAVREADQDAQHRLRIVVKHFRYRSELMAPLAPAGYDRLCQHFKQYQDILGRMHDCDVFAGIVCSRAGNPAKEALLEMLRDERHRQFTSFTQLLQSCPLTDTGNMIRALL